MTPSHIVETFNTHRMLPEVVRTLATGRDEEVHQVLVEIRHAAAHPETSPQHLIIYGERGSGKSFLLRMVELEVEHLARAENLPIVCALLPEEQYNIKSLPQLLEAIAAKVCGADWSVSAYAFDARPAAAAWDAAVKTLHQALDQRFGPGRGLVVAMIENFDTLAKTLFGAEPPDSSKKKDSAMAIERRAAEERLRKFMGRKDSRFMLIASATGTVDLDYERPLFLVFKSVDLTVWDGDTSIAYFNRRRKLAGVPELSPDETARARAIAEFIGGNPRLAQLLAEVLNVPDARTIAQTLDALSDHLADYYRRRLDDLPPNAAGLLDALIRTGEPCSQSELAQRVGASGQQQIADAFNYLLQGRLLSAVREHDGRGTLYRVRDRLFVHFYRRRYGGAEQSSGLTPIVELLTAFFSATERAELARRHLEAGEFAEARLFRGLGRTLEGEGKGYDAYRDGLVTRAPGEFWKLTGLRPEEIEPAQTQLRDDPDQACKRWGEAAKSLSTPLQRTVAKLLQAVAASRLDDDAWAQELLEEALARAETDVSTDARILAVDQMAIFSWHHLKDQKQALEKLASLREWADVAQHAYPKIRGYLGWSFSALQAGHYRESLQAAEAAANLARSSTNIRSLLTALEHKAWSLGQLDQHQYAIAVSTEAVALARQVGDVGEQTKCLRYKAWSLGELGQHEAAIAVCDEAVVLAQQVGEVREQTADLRLKARSLGQLQRVEEALIALDQAISLAKKTKYLDELSQALRLKSEILESKGQLQVALDAIQEAMSMADQASIQKRQGIRAQYFRIAAKTPAPDVIARLAEGLKETTINDLWQGHLYFMISTVAVTRAEAWTALQALVQDHRDWFANAKSFAMFSGVGAVWADFVKGRGRAETFALVARDLPVIAEVMKQVSLAATEEPEDRLRSYLRDLVAGLVSHCDDAGFLHDVADLVVEVFGQDMQQEAEAEASRLRAFAEFHAANDNEKVLQRFDPDLAKAIRRMWNVPEPEDLLARRGRRKGR